MEQHDKTEDLAVIDYLTQLPNRRGLYDFYNSIEPEELINVMFMDIDNFKKVNDTYGHRMGDDLLIAVTKKIKEKVPQAYIARVGGDEFVMLSRGEKEEKEIIAIAETILNSVIDLEIAVDIKAIISLSIGLICNELAKQGLDDLLFKCDAAMYQAKRNGKNGYVIYDTIKQELDYKKSVEKEMKDALVNGQFQIYLQPQMNMISSRVVGSEALVRWMHPVDGIRTPSTFLHLLEENGFVVEMDMCVYEQVCQLRQKWKDTPMRTIPTGVNMSKLHLYQPDFVEELVTVAKAYEVDPSEIVVEITENMHEDGPEMIRTINELRKAGFGTAIDDFGSGYTTLSMLHELDVDVLKLDEEFLVSCETNPKSKVIVKNLISMARELHLELVVEGVTNMFQERFLTTSGCDIAQGYYYSKPIPPDEFELFCAEHLHQEDKAIQYHFTDNRIVDENGEHEGVIVGDVEFGTGIIEGVGSLKISGGAPMTNIVQLPTDILGRDSFTICMWVKMENPNNWTSVFFAQADNGFVSIMPYAWEQVPMFRFKDVWDDIGFYDALGRKLDANKWAFLCVTYNAKSALARVYQNGVLEGKRDNVMQLSEPKQVVIGGDYYQISYNGYISELSFFNYAKTEVEIKEMYNSYITNPTFIGH